MRPADNPPHPANCVFLIGLRGSGKSAVGRELGVRLGCPWYDSDREIERETGRSIESIFADQGEPAFRDFEAQCIRRLIAGIVAEGHSGIPAAVISLGGGAVLASETRDLISRSGRTIWLDAEAPELVRRLENDPASHRPSLTGLTLADEVGQLRRERIPVYSGCADFRVDTTALPVSQVAEKIANWLAGADS